MSNDPIERTAQLLAEASSVLLFTGAGISTGSGIPDFRGPSGLWKTWKPVYYDEFVASDEARRRHWDFKLSGWEGFRDARPNAAHRALVELEKLGKLQLLVTQNIDGLHQLAGQSAGRVVELHGTNREIECIRCGKRFDPDPIFERFSRDREPPRCEFCDGFLKPATVSFGQQMPQGPLDEAFKAALECDLVISAGSTLEVEPAASVPLTAQQNGACYIIINRGPTAHDSLADLRLEGDVNELLPAIVKALKRRLA